MSMGIEGVTGTMPVLIPGQRTVEANFEINQAGMVVLMFKDEQLAKEIVVSAVKNEIVAFGFDYVVAKPQEG